MYVWQDDVVWLVLHGLVTSHNLKSSAHWLFTIVAMFS